MNDKVFHQHLHFFRGVSILLIVAAHCWSMPIYLFNDNELPSHLKPLFSSMEMLFHGSTIYFALISGLLFSLVLSEKPYKQFMKTKLRNVFIPFVLISLFYVGIWAFMGMFNPPEDLSMLELILGFSFFLITGHMSGHLWYIPIIMLLFAITPLLVKVVNSKQRIWFVILLLLPLVISRVWPNFHPASLIYFIGPYMLGIYIGSHMQEVEQWIAEKQILLCSLFALFSGIYYILLINDINHVEWGFYSLNPQETVTYILRMSVALLMLRLFQLWVTSVPRVIDYLARYAFAIYFIHVAFIMLFVQLAGKFDLAPTTLIETLMFGVLTLVGSVLSSIAVSWLIKQLTGRYSRMLIGA